MNESRLDSLTSTHSTQLSFVTQATLKRQHTKVKSCGTNLNLRSSNVSLTRLTRQSNQQTDLIRSILYHDLYYERIRSNLYYITGMGESTNGSDLYYWEQYKHSNTHDNLIYESINKWIRSNKQIQWNWSDSNRYCTYFICHHNTQQATSTVRTVSIHH